MLPLRVLASGQKKPRGTSNNFSQHLSEDDVVHVDFTLKKKAN